MDDITDFEIDVERMFKVWQTLQEMQHPTEDDFDYNEFHSLLRRYTYVPYDIAYILFTKPEYNKAIRLALTGMPGTEAIYEVALPILKKLSESPVFMENRNAATRELMDTPLFRGYTPGQQFEFSMKTHRKRSVKPRKTSRVKRRSSRRKSVRRKSLRRR